MHSTLPRRSWLSLQQLTGRLRLAERVRGIDRAAALIIAAGVGLRLAWALSSGVQPDDDATFYHRHAVDLAHGNGVNHPLTGEPTAFLPPGYAGLLAGVFRVTGDSLVAGALLNIVLGGVGLVLTYLLARHFFSVPAARLATGVLAAFPSQVLYVSVLMPDVLSQTLVIAIVWLALVRPDWRRVLLAGALSGALALTAPREMLLLVGILVGWRFVAPWRLCLARAGVMLGVATAVVLPWTVRNAVVIDAFVPVSTNAGVNFWIGHNPDTYGGWMAWDDTGRSGTWTYPVDEVATDREFRDKALRYIRDHPLETVRNLPGKLRVSLEQDYGYISHFAVTPRDDQLGLPTVELLEWLVDDYFAAVLVLAGLCAGALAFRRHRATSLVVVTGALFAPTLIFAGLDRYHVTAIPLLSILAAPAVLAAVRWPVAERE